MSHTDRLFGEPDGAFGTSTKGDRLVFACARCDECFDESALNRSLFTSRIENHYRNTHDLEVWNVRNLDASTTEALSCIFDGQPDWLHSYDDHERN